MWSLYLGILSLRFCIFVLFFPLVLIRNDILNSSNLHSPAALGFIPLYKQKIRKSKMDLNMEALCNYFCSIYNYKVPPYSNPFLIFGFLFRIYICNSFLHREGLTVVGNWVLGKGGHPIFTSGNPYLV